MEIIMLRTMGFKGLHGGFLFLQLLIHLGETLLGKNQTYKKVKYLLTSDSPSVAGILRTQAVYLHGSLCYSFPQAVTKYHKLGGLKQEKFAECGGIPL
jgi:hypothetical protein